MTHELMQSGSDPEQDITVLLEAWREGDPTAIEKLMPAVYPKLRYIADSFLRRERPGRTLQATELVNELYFVIARKQKVNFDHGANFFGLAAHLMRLILRDRARARKAQKRGNDPARVPLSEDLAWIDASGTDMLDLDRALEELTVIEPRKVKLLEITTFLGCSVTEAAELAGVSKATADRDLRFAKAWLYDRLRGTGVPA